MYRGKNRLIALEKSEVIAPQEIKLEKISYPKVPFREGYQAWSIMTMKEDNPLKIRLKNQIENYNNIIDLIFQTEGFFDFFQMNNFCINRKQIIQRWDEELANKLLTLDTMFESDICAQNDWLFCYRCSMEYAVEIEGEEIHFTKYNGHLKYNIRKDSILSSRDIWWNFSDDERDFTYSLWMLLGLDDFEYEEDDDYLEQQIDYSNYDCYEQGRDCMENPDIRLVRCINLLEKLGYIKTYYIEPEKDKPWWGYGSKDSGIDLAVVDMDFFKDKLIKEKIDLLTKSDRRIVERCLYFLTDSNNKQYLSEKCGKYGGHRKLKIYGLLNCPSALRYIGKGQYVKHRVFFEDDMTAISAGYRPCGVCMKEEYKKWKNENTTK